MQEELCGEFASYFEGKSMQELDDIAKSFKLGKFRPLNITDSRADDLQITVSRGRD